MRPTESKLINKAKGHSESLFFFSFPTFCNFHFTVKKKKIYGNSSAENLKRSHVVLVPDDLVDEVVGVLGGKDGERGSCWHSFLEADGLGVDREDGRLVDILHWDGDARRGLQWGLDAASQVGLVGHHHCQHEGAIHLKIHRLEPRRRREDGTRLGK